MVGADIFQNPHHILLYVAMGRLGSIRLGLPRRGGVTLKPLPRGRPAHDDQEILRKLAHLIRSTRNLPPTTALKLLGITDPSDIRRLRDKHRNFRRVIPGKSAIVIDQVYLTKLFSGMKKRMRVPHARIDLLDSVIRVIAGTHLRMLALPERMSQVWIKETLLPTLRGILRDARDEWIAHGDRSGVPASVFESTLKLSRRRVEQVRQKTKKVA